MDSMFRVGDRVRVAKGFMFEGDTGSVIKISNTGRICVEFDRYDIIRHDCNGLTKNGHGWWYRGDTSALELIEEPFPDVEDLI